MRIYDREKTYKLLVTLKLIKGIYEVIVASDEKFLLENEIKNSTTGTGKREKDKESGVARGIDFQFVSNVINFDFPVDTDSYIHRVGRTARGKNKGMSFKSQFFFLNGAMPTQTNRKTRPFWVQGIRLVPDSLTLAVFVVDTIRFAPWLNFRPLYKIKTFSTKGIFISCQPRLKLIIYYDLVSMVTLLLNRELGPKTMYRFFKIEIFKYFF